MKTAYLEVRLVYVRKEKRTKGHVFVVMLALILKRHIERLLRRAYGDKRPAAIEALGCLSLPYF